MKLLTETLAPGITRERLKSLANSALEEDLGWGDLTTDFFIPAGLNASAKIVNRKPGVIAGQPLVEAVYRALDPSLRYEVMVPDGRTVPANTTLGVVSGEAGNILRGERVALNFLQRLSGIATQTARYVEAIAGTRARIIDTRKTTPGLRDLEKYAIRAGGGFNHRRNLSDGVLVKDNHLLALAASGLSLSEALKEARTRLPHLIKIEVEVDRLDQIEEALAGGADAILLDNMTPFEMRQAVNLIHGRAITEASGGINFETVRAIAESGVDLISSGALTHSTTALDIGLDFELNQTAI